MTIKEWPASATPDGPGMMVQVSQVEAMRLIKSLSAQMVAVSDDREEFTATRRNTATNAADEVYFSVSVTPQQTERVGNA